MERLIERCAGLDVHKKTVAACVRTPSLEGQRQQRTRTFTTTTKGLLALRDWLGGLGVTVVGMESTGASWKPVYYLLEDAMACWLLNARHLRNVPGRKTDVADAAWICQLVEHGLVRPSLVPPRPIRELCNLTRSRKTVSRNAPARRERLEKLLEDAGIKLSCVATDILGVSGRAMLAALVAGVRDPEIPAELAKGRLRAKIPLLQEAAGRPLRTPPRPHGERDAHRASTPPMPPSGGSAPRSAGLSLLTQRRCSCLRRSQESSGAPPR